MDKLSLNTIKEHLYDKKIFGLGSKCVKVQRVSQNNSINKDIVNYGLFSEKSNKWKEYLRDKYTNDEIRFNDSDFIFIHFANIPEISMEFYSEEQNKREVRAHILNGNDKRVTGLRKSFFDVLYKDYKRMNGLKSMKHDNGHVDLGESIDAIIASNEYIIKNYCMDLSLITDSINSLIDICENDNSFLGGKEEKKIFLAHIKAYLRKKEEINDMVADEDKWIYEISYVLSWLLIAALLRDLFSEFAKIIPDGKITVLLKKEREFDYICKVLNKRIVEEINNKLRKSQIENINEQFFLKGVYKEGDKSFLISLWDLFQKSWVSVNRVCKNLIITGEGGIGKTLSVLSIINDKKCNIYNIPSIYVPLNKLGGYESIQASESTIEIEKNIRWYIKKTFSAEEYEIIDRTCKRKDSDLPRIILILDGFNELNVKYQHQILKEIKDWEELTAVQIILTSRSSPDYRGEFGLFESFSLDEKIVDNHLAINKIQFDGNKRILSTPLLLHLCCQSEKTKKSIDAEYFKRLEWHKVNHAADVFWNYLQYEIYRCHEKHMFTDIDGIFESDYFYLILQLCPYIAWRMTKSQILQIEEIELKKWINDSLEYLKLEKNIYDDKIEIERIYSGYVLDNRSDEIKANVYYLIFTRLNILMKKDSNDNSDEYGLIHQNMRDYLAALFIDNVLYKDKNRKGFLSDIVTQTGNIEVLDYLSHIASEDDLLKIWDNIKVDEISTDGFKLPFRTIDNYKLKNYESKIMISPEHPLFWDYRESVNWFLKFFGIKYNNDYSNVDFSNMDLTYISLADCRDDSMKLTLPKNPEYFKNTRISKYTFNRIGHTNKVNAVCVIRDLNICISGDSDGKIYAWDLKNNKFKFILDCYGSEIWDIKYVKRNNDYYVLACNPFAIDLFCINEKMIDEEKYNWIAPINSFVQKGGHLSELFSDEYVIDECHTICFYQDDNLHICFASVNGDVGRYNIDKGIFEDTLISDNKSYVNKVEVIEYLNNYYCIAANKDFSLNVWKLYDPKWRKKIKVSCNNQIHDDFSFIENSNSESKNTWDNKLTGITDFKIFRNNKDMNIIFSDSNGRVYISKSIFHRTETDYKLLGKGNNGHTRCVNKIELFNVEKEIWAITCSNDKTIIKWNLKTDERIGEPLKAHNDWVTGIKKLDNNRFLSFGHDNSVYVWDIHSYKARKIQGNTIDWILCGDIYKKYDEEWLVTGDASGAVSTWNISDCKGAFCFTGFLSDVQDVKVFDRDGIKYLAVASKDGVARIWSLSQKKCVAILEGHEGWINSIYPCHKGNTIITCGSDKTVRVFEIRDMNNPRVTILKGHSDWVLDVDVITEYNPFSFVTCSYDGTFIIWNQTTTGYKSIKVGNDLRNAGNPQIAWCNENESEIIYNNTMTHEAGIKKVKVFDSKRIITGGYDGKVVLWNLNSIKKDRGKVLAQHKDWVRDIIVYEEEDGEKHILSSSVDGRIIQYNYSSLDIEKVYCLNKKNSLDYNLQEVNRDDFILYMNATKLPGEYGGVYITKMLQTEKNTFVGLTNRGDMLFIYKDSKMSITENGGIESKSSNLFEISKFGEYDGPFNIFSGITNITPYDGYQFVAVRYNDEIRVLSSEDAGILMIPEGWLDQFIRKEDDNDIDDFDDEDNDIDDFDDDPVIGELEEYEKSRLIATIILHGVSVIGLDFSKAIYSNDDLKILLQQNGAIV